VPDVPTSVYLVYPPTIRVNGAGIPLERYADLIDIRVTQSVSVPSQATLRFSDPEYELIDGNTFSVADDVEVLFANAFGDQTSVFQGEIVSIGTDQNVLRADACELVITAFDRSHRLGSTTRVRTFQAMTYREVLSSIAGDEGLGLEADVGDLTFDYLIQTTSNYAFLNEIAFRTGCEWRIEGQQLKVSPRAASAAVAVEYGEDVRRLKTRYTAANEAAKVTVRSWDPRSKSVISGQATIGSARSNSANTGTAPLGTAGREKANRMTGTNGHATASVVANSSDEAQQLADALGARLATSDLSARGECIGNPEIRAGGMVEIKNAGTRLSGTYYVTAVEHSFGRDGDMTTTFTCGGLEPTSIVDLLGGGEGNVDGFGRIGFTVGIVTNNQDPDRLGRVRVKFPALSDSEESWWARVVTPGGGAEAGLSFMPQINDEVLVGFEHGDLRRPYVLGGLWGPNARPPWNQDTYIVQNKVIEWGLRTAAGHTMAIRGGDSPNEKHFKVTLADGTKLYLGSDKVEVVTNSKSIELKSGDRASVLLSDQGDVTVRGVNVTIEATSKLTLKGVNMDAKATASLAAEGGASLALKGGATAKLESDGMTEVKGSLLKLN
jgi:phage protein D